MILAALALLQGATQPAPVPFDRDSLVFTEVRRADGRLVARAMAWPTRRGIEVRVQAAGLPAGHYGVHLHAVGRCDGPAFESAGPHWNPTGRRHGKLNPDGHHSGDLDNLDVDESGAGRLEFRIEGGAIGGAEGLFDADNAALVIHAGPDDYRTDPAGNSGARIACGVLAPAPAPSP
ncbi:MAG TPA: superoxide dismutase family protein [Allosphingosinicella sp.]|nr:superoxide dismutase family protein [Allosphingosinicella sp.]